MKIIKVILIILFIGTMVYLFPVIMNEKVKLPNGTLVSRNRFTGQIFVKPRNSDTYFISP